MIRKPLTEIRSLPTTLSREERDDRARALATSVADHLRVATTAKVVASDYKEQLKEIDTSIQRLQRAVNSGVEDREVKCEIHLDGNVAHIVRTDTQETVDTRPATREELRSQQTTIFDHGA